MAWPMAHACLPAMPSPSCCTADIDRCRYPPSSSASISAFTPNRGTFLSVLQHLPKRYPKHYCSFIILIFLAYHHPSSSSPPSLSSSDFDTQHSSFLSSQLQSSTKSAIMTTEFSNVGQSIYHRYQGSFLADAEGNLVHTTGPEKQWIQDNWATFKQSRTKQNAKVYQNKPSSAGLTTGVIIGDNGRRADEAAFEEFFINLILDNADLAAYVEPATENPDTELLTEQIVNLFDSYLRYEGKGDKWVVQGRAYFTGRVRHFTQRNAVLELCLPAFPCKSSNIDKVTGPDPDRGEELALERLHGFVQEVNKIYPPGAKMWVISDGHVFSDCIGVDDGEVDRYGELLKDMNEEVGKRMGSPDNVGFKSLVDLFQLASATDLSTLTTRFNIPTIDHHVATALTEEAELCRRILMSGCGPRKEAVRAKIDSKDPAITALYRGFSRFMLEDLEYHPSTKKLSRKKQKAVSSNVAFEMILRNQAYSNLVELLFPNYVRLSIHAHNNGGPKFGIQLFDTSKVRTVESLSPEGDIMTSVDLLHIPTPWHNCVVELAGSEFLLVTKAKLARTAIKKGSFTGSLAHNSNGRGYFSLTKRPKRPIIVTVTEKISSFGKSVATPIRASPALARRATFALSEKMAPSKDTSAGPKPPRRMFTFSPIKEAPDGDIPKLSKRSTFFGGSKKADGPVVNITPVKRSKTSFFGSSSPGSKFPWGSSNNNRAVEV
ncbi:putative pyoverdine/dityrosine biosynthesis protein [Cladorrhinum sp. PSN259]|nr:putative pyoverdine/dityrosine biosynthesis protein [Cladorrhinum sp. PSN259]